MPLSVTVAGVDRTSQCRFEHLQVVNSIAAKADTADLVFTTTGSWHPQAANVVYVSHENTTEFGGVITEVREEQVNPSQFRYICNCRDFVYLLDRTLVVQSTTAAQPASTVIKSLVSSYSSGFTTSGVQVSPNVPVQTFDYMPLSDCIQGMAETIGWGWGVTYDRDVAFYSLATKTAPVATINVDSDTTTYGNMVISENVQNVHNSIFLKGFGVKSSATYVSQFKGDAQSKFFLLGYEPGSTSSADISITRTPVGSTAISQTINIDTVDGTPDNPVGTANDAFVCYDNMGIRYDVAPGSSDIISATYTVMREIPVNTQDTVSQSTMAAREGGSGVHEFVVNDPGLKSNDGTDALALWKGQSLLTRYAFPRFQITFRSFIQGWAAGQSVVVTSAKRFGGFTKTMYVQQVTKRLVNHPGTAATPTLLYDVQLSDQALAL